MLRGRRSRNKVSVGEPAEGSIIRFVNFSNPNRTWSLGPLTFVTAYARGRFCGKRLISLVGLTSLLTLFFYTSFFFKIRKVVLQLLAMDVSARTTMKDAANCDKRCEWQNSANQENAERILRSQVTPESMPSSGRSHIHALADLQRPRDAFMCASDV